MTITLDDDAVLVDAMMFIDVVEGIGVKFESVI